ncbi:hypothetical protein TWF225_003916 [Orbilia oligospora]|uniref:Uncharacterized protein n=2 Tax=Orbilia oligospora TaxID=2813651 RepID=A0A7C8PYB9_ORBOL|nr:hypothetical protein TWF751_000009 [Orbilia oligospora]KAF3188148.1 hypothetical protein TWF225_003916 [Orbilia oligospora]KAF3256784.1 hypothetical protein TWF128_005281 [Orbilia oligospora]KAF3258692.1 hypothetical protein TWF217_005460 [Orbilia oligospora]KAF3295560.1 hypothetical protein TWF132_001600 [Orbilia oligospora]
MADTYYYDLLGIPQTASDIEVKKAYRRQAFISHPDKNPGNAEAHKKFLEISEAYRILSDSHLRAHYDQSGREGVDEDGSVDASEMFGRMFSGESFQDWVGDNTILTDIIRLAELHLGGSSAEGGFTMVDSSRLIDDGDSELSYGPFDGDQYRRDIKQRNEEIRDFKIFELQEQMAKKREQRISFVAEKLADKLDVFAKESKKSERKFRIAMEREAEHLKLESFGVHILNTIGDVYKAKATEHGWYRAFGVLSTAYYYPQEKYASAKDTAKTVWNLLDAQKAIREARLDDLDLADAERIKAERGPEEQQFVETIAAGKMLMACWGLVRKDLIGIIKEACNIVLYDERVPYSILERRARAAMIIGEIFSNAHRDANDHVTEGLFEKIVSDSYELAKQRDEKVRDSDVESNGAPESRSSSAMAF